MTEPARLLSAGHPTIELSRGVQYVVDETDAERAKEISGEFYPNRDAADDAPAEPTSGQSEKDEELAKICELARRLGYNDAKAKMLIGQSAGNLAELERKLLNELDERPEKMPQGNGHRIQHASREKEVRECGGTSTPTPPGNAAASEPTRDPEGFLF